MEHLPTTRSVELIDHLIRLSSVRDRDSLLHCVTQALADTVSVHQVEIHSLVQDEDRSFWLPLTRALAGSGVRFLSDPLRSDWETMTPVHQEPDRLACLDQGKMVQTIPDMGQLGHLTRFPVMLTGGSHPWGVVEMHSSAPLCHAEVTATTRLIAMYGNMLDMLDYSECDALTGLWNRKPFDDLFYKTMPLVEAATLAPTDVEHRAAPTASFWLVMIDIDHFKQVNDTYGHLIGDEVLLLVARILKSSFRVYDRIYRFGGEEFVVVLRCSGHEAAVAAAERFRSSMAAHEFPQVGHITASVGLTEIVAGDSPLAACERADQAVYYAKHHGRNQVCSDADLVRRGLMQAHLKTGEVELF